MAESGGTEIRTVSDALVGKAGENTGHGQYYSIRYRLLLLFYIRVWCSD